MADEENKTNTQSIGEKYADRLSAGTYTWKKVREILISFGSMIGGGFAGYGVHKLSKDPEKMYDLGNFVKERAAKQLEGDALAAFEAGVAKSEHLLVPAKYVKTGVGAFIGALIGGVILGYEHWRKVESSKLGIDEINNDVSNMKIRQRTDPELIKENDRLRAMLEETSEKPKSKFSEKIEKPENYTERTESKSDTERSLN